MRFVNHRPRFRVACGRGSYNRIGWLEVRILDRGFYWNY